MNINAQLNIPASLTNDELCVFECELVDTPNTKGWKYFYDDENNQNQHSEFFTDEQECRRAAFQVLKKVNPELYWKTSYEMLVDRCKSAENNMEELLSCMILRKQWRLDGMMMLEGRRYTRGVNDGDGNMSLERYESKLIESVQKNTFRPKIFPGFWNRLQSFVSNVRVNDPMSEEEKGMILHVCLEQNL